MSKVKFLGPPVGYVDLLEHETREHLKKSQGITKSPLRPSASGKCTRELFYEFMTFHKLAEYPRESYGPELHRIFALGHSIEWHLIKQFELIAPMFDIRYKQQVLSFAKLESKNPAFRQWVEGSLDMVFWSEKYRCVADVKSKKDRWSKGFRSNWDETTEKLRDMDSVEAISEQAFWVDSLPEFLEELDDPFFAANFLQLNLYANSQFLRERGVDHGAIIQYGKNDSRLREVRFRPSTKLYDAVIEKFQTVVDSASTGKPPARDYASKDTFKCRYCTYKKECWSKKNA